MPSEIIDPEEQYPLTPSTAFLALAALLTIRKNDDDEYDTATLVYVSYVLDVLRHQPATVTSLRDTDIAAMGATLIDNSHTWLHND